MMQIAAVKTEQSPLLTVADPNWSGEAMIYCLECKAIETILIRKGNLVQTRKYWQADGKIFHDCGANSACRLYY